MFITRIRPNIPMTWHGTPTFDRVWYTYIFGGAVLFKPYEFEQVNGFSNLYYGWGGEDDDMSGRYVIFVARY